MAGKPQSAKGEDSGGGGGDPSGFASRLAEEAARLRASGALGRSDALERLFDFLLERSLEGRLPKEFEVAQEVFGKGSEFDMVQDASVRVAIHRLRRKLEEHNAAKPADGDRIVIPRGEYRLTLEERAAADPPAADPPLADAPPPRPWRTRNLVALLAVLAAIAVAGWGLYFASRSADPEAAVVKSAFWSSIAGSDARTLVVAGDYYLFGEAPGKTDATRLVRESGINSREDLDQFMMAHPDTQGRYVDVDLHYLPTGSAAALSQLLPVADAAAARVGRPRVLTMSGLTPDMLKNVNVVYVGFLSGLGLLRDPLFQASGFKPAPGYDALIDRATGRRYSSDWNAATSGKTPRRDFGYLASLPSPIGTRVLIVAGTRDAAVIQAAEIATDARQLARLDGAAGSTSAFEALYEVRSVGTLNIGNRLVLARPLRVPAIWQADPAPPDQATRH